MCNATFVADRWLHTTFARDSIIQTMPTMKALSPTGIRLTAGLIVTVLTAQMTAAQDGGSDFSVLDSTAVAETVDQFRAAIAGGDSVTVAGLLFDDVVMLESGSPETKHEFLSHHFRRDVAFLSAVSSELLSREVSGSGDVAWVASISRMHGTFREREIDRNSAELAVLRRTDDGWGIAAIHWSSRSNSE